MDAVKVTGEEMVESARECAPYTDAFETGEIKLVHSTGSVWLRCIGGRVAVYEAIAGGLFVADRTRRCPCALFGPPAGEASTPESCVRILGSRVGPCWRRTGEWPGVVRLVMMESGDVLCD